MSIVHVIWNHHRTMLDMVTRPIARRLNSRRAVVVAAMVRVFGTVQYSTDQLLGFEGI